MSYGTVHFQDMCIDVDSFEVETTLQNPFKNPGTRVDIHGHVKYMIENLERYGFKILSDTRNRVPEIKNVKFHDPATIVFWADGTKTVVKCGDEDTFDPEKGLAMAIAKKALGNKGHYFDTVKKWTDRYSEEDSSK